MEHSTRLAHISEDGTRTQTVYDHLAGTAGLAGSFAAPFGAQREAEFAAWLHDVGKYSDAFQLRLKGGPKVDHSTAGAQEAWVRQHLHTAFAVAGHHSGLPDGGSPADDPGDATLFGRSKKPVAPYDGWQEVTLPASTPPAWACADPLSLAFFTRMLCGRIFYPDALLLPRGRRLHRHRDLHGRQGRTPGQRRGHRRAAGHRLGTGAALSQGRIALARQRPAQRRPPRLPRERRARPAGALHPHRTHRRRQDLPCRQRH